ncbi:hypothetical protein ACNKHK_25510 [Shigella flexneri]
MKKAGYLLLAVIVVAAAAGIGYWRFTGNPWTHYAKSSFNNACSRQQQRILHHAEVKADAGYVVLKTVMALCNIC